MANIFSGVVRHVGELETGTTSTGKVYNNRAVRLETVEEFPQSVIVTLRGDKARDFALNIGSQVDAYLRFSTFQSKESGRFFNEINCWRIDPK